MSEPFDPGVLERLTKSVCIDATGTVSGAELSRMMSLIQQCFVQIQAAPFLFSGDESVTTNNLNVKNSDGITVAAVIRWAQNVGGILVAPAAANGWVGIVKGWPCKDHKGNGANANQEIFLIRGKADQTYAMSDGTIFKYQYDNNGIRFVLDDPLADTADGGGGGDDATYQHNEVDVDQQPILDFVDTATVVFTLTADGANSRVKVSAAASYPTYPVLRWAVCKSITDDPCGRAERDADFGSTGHNAPWVEAHPCDDIDGAGVVAMTTLQLAIGPRDCIDRMLHGGDIVGYLVDENSLKVIVTDASKEIIFFELDEDKPLGDPAAAHEICWHESEGEEDEAGYDRRGSTITVHDFYIDPLTPAGKTRDGMFRGFGNSSGKAGYRGMAVRSCRVNDGETGGLYYNIIWMEHIANFVEGYLSGPLSGGTATLTVERYWDGRTPGTTVTITDTDNKFKRALASAKCMATYDNKTDKYRPVNCQQMTEKIGGLMPLALERETTNFDIPVADIYAMNHAPNTQLPEGTDGILNIVNTYKFQGDENAEFEASWDEHNQIWKLTQLPCPETE